MRNKERIKCQANYAASGCVEPHVVCGDLWAEHAECIMTGKRLPRSSCFNMYECSSFDQDRAEREFPIVAASTRSSPFELLP